MAEGVKEGYEKEVTKGIATVRCQRKDKSFKLNWQNIGLLFIFLVDGISFIDYCKSPYIVSTSEVTDQNRFRLLTGPRDGLWSRRNKKTERTVYTVILHCGQFTSYDPFPCRLFTLTDILEQWDVRGGRGMYFTIGRGPIFQTKRFIFQRNGVERTFYREIRFGHRKTSYTSDWQLKEGGRGGFFLFISNTVVLLHVKRSLSPDFLFMSTVISFNKSFVFVLLLYQIF